MAFPRKKIIKMIDGDRATAAACVRLWPVGTLTVAFLDRFSPKLAQT